MFPRLVWKLLPVLIVALFLVLLQAAPEDPAKIAARLKAAAAAKRSPASSKELAKRLAAQEAKAKKEKAKKEKKPKLFFPPKQ